MINMPNGESLTQEIAKELPIYCYVDKSTIRLLMRQGVPISEKTRLEIIEVHYMGEAGGITCVVENPDGRGVLAMSATQVRFPDEGAVYDKLNEYKKERTQWLQQEELKDKMLGRSGRINVVETNKDGSMRCSGDDGTEIITFPSGIIPKIPRNALCPCGSGKKFKKCCGVR